MAISSLDRTAIDKTRCRYYAGGIEDRELMDFKANIQGMEQLKANSEKIAKEARKAASESVMRQAEMVRDAIRERAPQGPTGNLKRAAIAKMMPEKGGYPPIAIAGIDRRKAPHAALVEFGGHDVRRPKKSKVLVSRYGEFFGIEVAPMPARPFFRPAVDETKEKVKENLKNDIKRGIESAV